MRQKRWQQKRWQEERWQKEGRQKERRQEEGRQEEGRQEEGRQEEKHKGPVRCLGEPSSITFNTSVVFWAENGPSFLQSNIQNNLSTLDSLLSTAIRETNCRLSTEDIRPNNNKNNSLSVCLFLKSQRYMIVFVRINFNQLTSRLSILLAWNTPMVSLPSDSLVSSVSLKLYGVNATIIIFVFVLYCVLLYCIVLYCIVLYCIVLYYFVLYCIVLYCIVLYCIVLYCIL